MKAVVFEGKDRAGVNDVDDATLQGDDSAVIEVEKASICGSDLHFYWAEFGDPAGLRPGHEFIGRVVAAGSRVERFSVGDRVIASGVYGCGSCDPCRANETIGCDLGWVVPGVGPTVFGGQAEAVCVPNADFNLCTLPSGMSAEDGVLLSDALPTGYNGAAQADITPGDTVAVFGVGPIGLAALLSAQVHGASRVLAVDLQPERRALAAKHGAVPIDPAVADPVEQIKELTAGRGADAVIEAVGVDATIQGALQAGAPGSTVMILGVSSNFALPLAPIALSTRNITLRAMTTPVQAMWPQLLPLLDSGRIDTSDFYSHRYRLDDAAEAYDVFAGRKDNCFKVLFDIG